MDISSIATAGFDAAHRIPSYSYCSSPHGHHWDVRVTVTGDLDPKSGWIRGAEHLQAALLALMVEIDNKDLDEMLPGVVSSPLGIASWILDRLALAFPRIVRVTVDCSDGNAGEIRRAPRP